MNGWLRKMRMKSEILKFIAFNVNLIIAIGGAVLAGAYYVSRKVANCKSLAQKKSPQRLRAKRMGWGPGA